jgi:transcriptional regulator with XRE-family HTH domain
VESVLKRLGKRIQELRRQRGFASQEKFADFCGVDRTFAGHLETGRRDFRLSSIIRVAEALEVPIADLFTEPGIGAAAKSTQMRRSGAGVERKRLLKTAASLEDAARTLKELAGADPPRRPPKKTKDGS